MYWCVLCELYIYIYIGWRRSNGDAISKTKLFSQQVPSVVAALNRYVKFVIYKCRRIFDFILRVASVILDHMRKPKIMEVSGKSAWSGFGLGLVSDQVPLRSQVLLSRNFLVPLVFLLIFQLMSWCSCFMIMIFPWLLKSWSCLLKCLQGGIALVCLASFLWLLCLMLNGVSDFPTDWMLQI